MEQESFRNHVSHRVLQSIIFVTVGVLQSMESRVVFTSQCCSKWNRANGRALVGLDAPKLVFHPQPHAPQCIVHMLLARRGFGRLCHKGCFIRCPDSILRSHEAARHPCTHALIQPEVTRVENLMHLKKILLFHARHIENRQLGRN